MPRILRLTTLATIVLAQLSACGGRPVSWGDSGSSTDGGDGGGGGGSSSLIGVWVKTVKQDGITQEVQFTFESTGACELLLNIPDFGEYPIDCTYSTSGDEMEISDTECEGDGYGSGTYSFTASSSTLSLSTLDDDCPTRAPLPGDWTRSSR